MRLTFWNDRKGHFDWHCENNEIADKLAAYEDTGYSPLEIKSLEGEWSTMRKVVDSYRKAEEQGFLVRLPCKVGDTVYVLRRGIGSNFPEVYPVIVAAFAINRFGCVMEIDDTNFYGYHERYNLKYWGKTVFFTREEAEAALKGEKKDV